MKTHQNAKSPARIAVLPSHGSSIPTKDMKMNSSEHNTGTDAKPVLTIDRRALLKALPGAAFAATLPTVIASGLSVKPAQTAKERAEYHLAELHAALEEATGMKYSAEIAWDVNSAFLFGRSVPGKAAS